MRYNEKSPVFWWRRDSAAFSTTRDKVCVGMKIVKTFLVALCRMILASAFWLSIRLSTSLTIHGVKYDMGAPRTYLGMTHKRDVDPFILLPTIIFHRGWKALTRDVRFALRGDGFTRGFLARVMGGRPAWLAWLLRPISVGPALRWLGTHPTDGLLRPAEEWMREVLLTDGDTQAGAILSPAFMQDFARATSLSVEQVRDSRLSHLLAWRYHAVLRKFYGPEMLLGTKRRHIERRVIARIHAQLDEIAACLWQDGSFFGSPEGQLSPDGRIGPLHAGFHRIVRAAPPDLRVVPIALTYDFMTTGRRHIFVNFAPALEYAPKLPQAELDQRLYRSWLLHMHFTCTQLASGFLMERQRSSLPEFTLYDLAHAVYQQACELAAAGRHVDPQLLRPAGVTRKVRGYLAYVERRGLIRRCSTNRWQITFGKLVIQVGPREVAYDEVPLLYAYNELQDLLSLSN